MVPLNNLIHMCIFLEPMNILVPKISNTIFAPLLPCGTLLQDQVKVEIEREDQHGCTLCELETARVNLFIYQAKGV